MKKFLSVMAAGVMLAGSLSMYSFADETEENDSKQLQIVTTIFPEYDWVMNVLGDEADHAEVTMLLDNGVDLHSYQPSAEDILKISTCDMFIYVGGESDKWVDKALGEAVNEDMVVINLMDVLGDRVEEEEVVEGMQEGDHHHDHEEDADHDHEEDADHDHAEEVEYDEHVWLSLRNAEVLTDSIAAALEEIDPDNADTYKAKAEAYAEQLEALDAEYEKAVADASVTTLLFGDRFPFRYLVDDYGLSYYAAFVGCSAETEASFETIMFLAQKVDELSLDVVMTIDGSDQKIAQTIVQSTKDRDQKILTLDSMQSVTSDDVAEGITYLSIMEDDLTVLKEALGVS